MDPLPRKFTFPALLLAATLPQLARADCPAAIAALGTRLQTDEIAALAAAARALDAEACPEEAVTAVLRQVSSLAARRAGAALDGGDAAAAAAVLDAAPVLHWEVLAMRGSLATAAHDHNAAAHFYNQALDVLGSPALTPQLPKLEQVVPRLMALAQESMMLADSARSTIRSDGASTGLMRAVSLAIVARQDASLASVEGSTDAAPTRTETLTYNVVTAAAAKIDSVYLPVRFDTDSDQLNKVGLREAQALAAFLRQQKGLTRLTLIGHTDDVGAEAYNLALSLHRAETVAAYLREAGVEAEIAVLGHGETQPPALVNGEAYTPEEQRAIARRVEVSFAGS